MQYRLTLLLDQAYEMIAEEGYTAIKVRRLEL